MTGMINLERTRADTPGCENRLHFNNAGASLMPTSVLDRVTAHLHREAEIGGYEAAAEAEQELAGFYDAAAQLLGARPQEIAYVENATRAWDMAFYALPLQPGDRILTHGSEYASNFLALLQQAGRRQLHVDVAPSDSHGQIDVAALESMITSRTRLIAITHVPSQGGLINPVAEVGQVAKRHGLLYLLDACQSLGQLDVNVNRIGCDMLSGTGRKFLRGPRGTGLLYVAGDLIKDLEPPFIDLHAATWTGPQSYTLADGARRFENWESFVAGKLGLGTAIQYALQLGLPAIERTVTKLAAGLRTHLRELDTVTLHDRGLDHCGIVTFQHKTLASTELAARLRAAGVNISVTPASYALLDLGARGLPDLARASVHYFNSELEVEQFCSIVAEL